LFVPFAEAGIINVYFSDDNVRYTLYTLNDGQAEYVHLEKVAQMFRFSVDVDPVDGRVVLRKRREDCVIFPGQATVIANRRSYFLELPPARSRVSS